MLCFAGMQKPLLHIRQIRVTAGKYKGKCIQFWGVVDVVDSWGTLAEMVWMGWFWLWSQIMWWQAVAVLPYATKWHVARCLTVQKASWGTAVCFVFSSCLEFTLSCQLIANGEVMFASIGRDYEIVGLSDNIFLCYLLPQYYNEKEDIKLLNECEANEST